MKHSVSAHQALMPRHGNAWALVLIAFTLLSPITRAADFIPASEMSPLYAAELGPLYHPADLNRIYAAHELLEKYFTAASKSDRKNLVAQLESTNLPPVILGRIVRLRLDWQNLAPGVYYVNETNGPAVVKYFLGIPKIYRRDVAWPLVVKLPSANPFIDEPMPDGDQVSQIYVDWIKDELADHPDALVLMPLLNLKELYGPSYAGMNSVYRPILDAADRCNVDPARVYLIGHSMAAHGVWNVALHYPTYFAAINPLAGQADADWQRVRLANLRNVLPVIWADTNDNVVPYRESSDIVAILRRQQIDVDYVQTSGIGHVPPPDVLKHDYLTLRSRKRDLYPQHVSVRSNRADTIFNRVDWIQVYQELQSGNDVPLRLQWGSGTIDVSQNACAVEAVVQNNLVTIATSNVEILRLYFNDKMVDQSKPVTVNVNGKIRFQGKLTESLDEMLKDQLFLGRGWRYFTSNLDLDLLNDATPKPAPNARSMAGSTASTAPTSRPHGRIIIYNDDGTQTIIEKP